MHIHKKDLIKALCIHDGLNLHVKARDFSKMITTELFIVSVEEYRIFSICAAPSNCAALHRYYSKGFIFVSITGNNFNCTAPSNSTAP